KGKIDNEKSPVVLASFIAFFPSLTSGPILRAEKIIPQLKKTHDFDYDRVTDGLKLFGYGLFKKLVVADNIAIYVNSVYGSSDYTGCAAFIAILLYSFEIYCDFSGYSDIAIGSAKILGIDIPVNFDHPYLSCSVTEFWRRWHISLSGWLRDYIYIGLGGSRVSAYRIYFNLLATFFVSALWHGIGLGFLIWGMMHGVLICIERFLKIAKASSYNFFRNIATFLLVSLAWVFFANPDIDKALGLITSITRIPAEIMSFIKGTSEFAAKGAAALLMDEQSMLLTVIPSVIVVVLLDIICSKEPGLVIIKRQKNIIRWLAYYAVIFALLFMSASEQVSFIYNNF
ncbi:MAG: hypothetical protein K6A23_07195, partial [Butyrivibrio sp.]|nr:hypothetical protein [Butyrivibrio sp.]